MESPTPSHLMILSTLFMILIFHSSIPKADSKLVQDICDSTAKMSPKAITYDDCVNALNLDPWSAVADLKGLARIALSLGQSNATDSKKFIKKLIGSKQTKPSLINPLKTCLSWYDAARNSFRSALLELEEDPLSANYDAKVAGDDADQCDGELLRVKAYIPSVTTRNKYVKLYSDIGFVITDRLS